MTDDDKSSPHKAIDFLFRQSVFYAKAKAERMYLEHFRKSKKALLMNECPEKAIAAREQYAYSHPDYAEIITGIKVAMETEETLRWQLVAAQARVEIWRTESANNRRIDRAAE